MRGELVFETLGGVDAKFILEADPHGVGAPMGATTAETPEKTPKGRRPMGGWVAAAVCAIVALGVYLGAMWLGQGEWQPPAVTVEGTETTETVVSDMDETADETITDPEPQPEPEPYVFANPHFIVEKIDGQYYFNLWRGNPNHNLGYIPSIDFNSMDAMFNAIYRGELTENQMLIIQSFMQSDENGYLMIDLWNMVEPVIPKGGQLKRITWSGSRYDFYYTHPDVSAGVGMDIFDRTEDDGWAKQEAYLKSKDGYPKTDVTVDGISAIATTQITETVTYINLYLSVEDKATDRELYIYAKYETTADVDPQSVVATASPTEMTIIGLQGNKRFSVQVNYGALPVLNTEFFLSFAVKPYEPPIAEPPTKLSADEPYVIEIIDGVHYLTFPEWDGTLLQISIPEGQSLRSPVYQTATELMEKIKAQELSCYEIEVFKLMADDNGRMRLPNTETYLAPSLPDYVPKNLGFTFNENGDYCGILEYSDCTGNYNCYFTVTSGETWKSLKENTLTHMTEGRTLLGVSEGTYDGMPCTFYEYSYLEDINMIFCHIRPSEGTHEKEYFISLCGEMYDLIGEENSLDTRTLENIYASGEAYIYGNIDGQYYYFCLQEVHRPTAEVLSDFSVTTVTP